MNEALFYDLRGGNGLAGSLATQVAREIGRRIVGGTYLPGQLIEEEPALVKRYSVSRSVVRDAVKMLVGKGLLEVRRGIGTRVRDRSNWGLLDDDVLAWQQSMPASEENMVQLVELRRVIEPVAARWAAERGDDADLKAIADALKQMEVAQGAIETFVIADASFHRAILHASKNDYLRAMEGIIFSALLNSIRLTNREVEENARSIPLHRAVSDAILNRDGDAASEAMSMLLSDMAKKILPSRKAN